MTDKTRRLTVSAITAAIIFAVTWMIRIPVPATSGGYVNIGDVVIYMAAWMFGGPVTAAAAAIGSALADTAAGAVVYIPATFVIKGIMGLVCGYLSFNRRVLSFAGSCVVGGAIMTLGYALYEWVVFGAAYAIGSLPFNLIQWGGSAVIAIALYPVAGKTLKKFILKSV